MQRPTNSSPESKDQATRSVAKRLETFQKYGISVLKATNRGHAQEDQSLVEDKGRSFGFSPFEYESTALRTTYCFSPSATEEGEIQDYGHPFQET